MKKEAQGKERHGTPVFRKMHLNGEMKERQ